ncbi:MAG: WxL domain-containing protein [Streptococcaceae bacterium]|nr:WxL domain-containing protein [Streptococcaceae bacterium]
MKKVILGSAAILALVVIGSQNASAATLNANGTVTTNGTISFTTPTTTTPVTPVNPTNPTTPIDPTNPTAPIVITPDPGTGMSGPLSLDAVTNFDFGTDVVQAQAKTYYAKGVSATQGTVTTNIPNYVQVTDVRGTLVGWNVTAAVTKEFTGSSTGSTLNGAVMTLSKAQITTSATTGNGADKALGGNTSVALGAAAQNIFGASAGKGAATNDLLFGTATSNNTDTASGVSLYVPGGAAQADSYSADITWTLSNTPA